MKAIFTSIDVLLSVRNVHLSIISLCDIDLCQTAISVSASYDALNDLFECVANFLKRLYIYTEMITSSSTLVDILVKIMIELLNVLALATEQIKKGRLSKWSTTRSSSLVDLGTEKFAKKLLGESDIEAILQRLDRLTQEEARMTGAHMLEVVHGLIDNLKVVMDGGTPYFSGSKQLTRIARVDGKASMIGIQQALSMSSLCETLDLLNIDEGC